MDNDASTTPYNTIFVDNVEFLKTTAESCCVNSNVGLT
jgi:hypothetical protein